MARFSGLSGTKSREWRKLVSTYAAPRKDYIRTIKFPLELAEQQEIDFERVKQLFDVTEGTGSASLFGILIYTHLAGFRAFQNSSSNLSFRELGNLEQDFSRSWLQQTSLAPKLSPSIIIDFAKVSRRKVKGERKGFSATTLFNDFAARIGLTGAGKATQSPELKFIRDFTDAIADRYSSWEQMNESSDDVIAIFDETARANGFSLPILSGSISRDAKLNPPKCTIAFDTSLLTTNSLTESSIAIHQVVAQKMHMLRRSAIEPKPEDVKAEITTNKNNALSWLFGSGFRYWRESKLEDICSDFDIPSEQSQKIMRLKSIYASVPEDPLFASQHYAAFRTSVGGKLKSWITNYVSQLHKIEDSLKHFEPWTPNEHLSTEEAKRYFRSLGSGYDGLIAAINQVESAQEDSKVAVETLLGKANQLPTESHVQQIESLSAHISSLAGTLSAIKNAIALDAESDEPRLIEQANNCDFQIPAWLKSLPKVNQISGGTIDVKSELNELQEIFRSVRVLKASYKTKLLANAREVSALQSDMATYEARERELLEKRPMNDATPGRQAKRKVLSRLCGIGKNGSEVLREILASKLRELFVKPKDLRKLLNGGLGSVYVSPFSTSRHQPLDLHSDRLDALSPSQLILSVKNALEEKVASERDFATYRDLLRVEDLHDSVELSRLPDLIPAKWVAVEEIQQQAKIPLSLQPLLTAQQISRQTAIKLSNLLTVQLNGALARAFRESFFVRTKFVRVGFNELNWVAKKRYWNPPKQVESSQGDLGDVIRLIREQTSNEEGPISPDEAAQVALGPLKMASSKGSATTSLLQQMPHDWYIDLKLANSDSQMLGYGVDKKKVKRKHQSMNFPCRLIGPSASKTLIDTWLKGKEIEIGEHNIMFEQHYRQTVDLDEDLSPIINVEPSELKAELALSFTDTRMPSESTHPLEESVIGIDLGEAGIGFAVFATKELQNAVSEGREPIANSSGSVPIRSVRDLIKRVKHHRKIVQPRQKFRQGASTALDQLRAGALGDTCFVIDGLCAEYNGFPVLESSVAHLASGGKQLQLIYDKIIHTYYFSDVDAHKAARAHHWAGAVNWEHPVLSETQRQKDKLDGRYKPTGARRPLKLFPGSAVHPAGTSQICSQCNRNPHKALSDSIEDDGTSTFSVEDGRVTFADGSRLAVLSSTDPAWDQAEKTSNAAKYRRLKERAPVVYPIRNTTLNAVELRKQIRNQLRHGQTSTRSKDTTQSVYTCMFEDCRYRMHADENAAINIVRKWVRDKGIHQDMSSH